MSGCSPGVISVPCGPAQTVPYVAFTQREGMLERVLRRRRSARGTSSS
ncbi:MULTISPECIES: hypothetical protein [Sorangium]